MMPLPTAALPTDTMALSGLQEASSLEQDRGFHGPANFQGHVDNHFHPEHGYTGTMPERGEKATPEHATPPKNFKGNEVRDGHGHVSEGRTK
ncbi:hypothetical protein RBB77_13125 [Tunturibacter psychrotolerans]|uniref:Uncharacterized protein n=1 Tax=Tunturiibacter psychrotolerans TaxID=3069686 RepID=A0AAU7ZKD6_9BACT